MANNGALSVGREVCAMCGNSLSSEFAHIGGHPGTCVPMIKSPPEPALEPESEQPALFDGHNPDGNGVGSLMHAPHNVLPWAEHALVTGSDRPTLVLEVFRPNRGRLPRRLPNLGNADNRATEGISIGSRGGAHDSPCQG